MTSRETETEVKTMTKLINELVELMSGKSLDKNKNEIAEKSLNEINWKLQHTIYELFDEEEYEEEK